MGPVKEDGFRIDWQRGTLYPLVKAFFGAIYGDPNDRLVKSASLGKTSQLRTWMNRGADLDVSGAQAIKVAYESGHFNTVSWLLNHGVAYSELPASAPPRHNFSLTPNS